MSQLVDGDTVFMVVASLAGALMLARCFSPSSSSSGLTQAQAEVRARTVIEEVGDGYGLDYCELIGCEPSGVVKLRLVNSEPTHNFLGSVHGGALATLIDVATSAAIAAQGRFVGVSVSLNIDYVNGCSHDSAVLVEARVLRCGRNLAFTECEIRRESDGVLMARGSHTKFVKPNVIIGALFNLPASLIDLILKRRFSEKQQQEPASFNASVEPVTKLPRNDNGKRSYFAKFADGTHQMQGWDSSLQDQLKSQGEGWTLSLNDRLLNGFGSLHGGCLASLVDVLGSSLIAKSDPLECGVAVGLSVQYLSSASKGTLTFEATMLKKGGRLCTVKVEAKAKGKLVAVGTVTKCLRGLLKAASSSS